jgi:hypothetical protein|tara:strand:+ start:68 stop:346 length:279 start_codon:yes stop_codon:yes gene_type:complete
LIKIKNKLRQNNSERGREKKKSPVRLPNLKSAYLEYPGEMLGLKKTGSSLKPTVRETINHSPIKMCGLCGTRHAVGEPHKAKNAAGFNSRTG